MRTVCVTSMWPGSQGEWTGRHMSEQQWLHCTSQLGQLSEHVYCVAIAFKMTEPVEQQICIKFCVKLEHPSMEDWDNSEGLSWWLAASSWLHACSCTMSCGEFFGDTSNHPGDSAPLQPRLDTLTTSGFPQTKIIFEREESSDHWWDSGKYDGQLMTTGRTVWGPKVPALKGTEASLSYVQCFLYLLQ